MAVIEEEMGLAVPSPASTSLARVDARRLGLVLSAAGWAALSLMWITGTIGTFGHNQHGVPAALALGAFLAGWTVMIAAMMLPSSLPTLARFDEGVGAELSGAPSRLMAGYFLAWGLFGAVAFAGDGLLHRAVHALPWLGARPELILASAAVLAGGAELLGRRTPLGFPAESPRASAFTIGRRHAVDRIRRCWPLTLFAMAVGMSSVAWMGVLTLLMALELRPRAAVVLRVAGAALIAVGVAVVVQPAWLPMMVGTA